MQSDKITINHEIIEQEYGGEENVLAMARPSPRIIEDSKKYVARVLNVSINKYAAFSFRTNNNGIH